MKDATKEIMKLPGPVQIINLLNPPEYFKANLEQRLSRCQYHKGILVGDETGDWCNLSDHPCMVAYGDYDCEEYNELKEQEL